MSVRRGPATKDKRLAARFAESFSERRCVRKVRYSSRNAARDAAIFMNKREQEPFEFYRCKDGCGGWHVGHPRGWRRKAS